MEVDHEILSIVLLFLSVIQEGILSVTSQSVCTKYYTAKSKIVSEFDREIPQSQTADNPMATRGRAAPGRKIKQSDQLSLPHQNDCNTRIDIK